MVAPDDKSFNEMDGEQAFSVPGAPSRDRRFVYDRLRVLSNGRSAPQTSDAGLRTLTLGSVAVLRTAW